MLPIAKLTFWAAKKIRSQIDRQTDKVTSSLLELLVAAKNMYRLREEFKTQNVPKICKSTIEIYLMVL